MKLNFCTLFDSNYMAKGLCMYESLRKCSSNFHLYIFAFDDLSHSTLLELNLESVTVISLSDFEDSELLRIKPTRTAVEYCWTCTPSIILYCIETYLLKDCTYIDADLLFFSDPKVLIEELGNDDVLITEHRYTPEYDNSERVGKYCVQFMTFRNTENGLKVLNWWRDACIDWCYNYVEDGKLGDQKYLDDWTSRFTGIHELKHVGGGVAPWNVQQYEVFEEDGKLKICVKSTEKVYDFVFYHFHHLNNHHFYFIDQFYFCPYVISPSAKKFIYVPYIKALKNFYRLLKKKGYEYDSLGTKMTIFPLIKVPIYLIKNLKDPNRIFWLKI